MIDSCAIAKHRLKVVREQIVFVRDDALDVLEIKKNSLEKNLDQILDESCKLDENIKRHLRVFVDYDENKVVYIIFMTTSEKLRNKIHEDLDSRTSEYEQ